MAESAGTSTAGTLVIRGATLVDVLAGEPRPSYDVRIDGGVITEVAPGVTVDAAEAAQEIKADGLWLIPGLVDCHVHLVGSNVGREPFGRYLERNPDTRVLRIAAHAACFILAGVTAIRHLGHGDPAHVDELQKAIGEDLIVAPTVLSCGWAVSQTAGHGDLPQWPYDLVESLQPSAAFCDGPIALREFVREQEQLGASWIKVFATQGTISTPRRLSDLPNFSQAELDAVVDEAHRIGLRVAAHATSREGAIRALRAGVDTLEHGPSQVDDEFVQTALEAGATVVPTLSVVAWAAREGSQHGLPPWATSRASRRLQLQMESLRVVHGAGIPIAVGSDSGTLPRVMGTNEEVGLLAEAGFTPAEILRMASVNGSRALGLDGVGAIEVGRRGDLVAVRSNPLSKPAALADPSLVAFVTHNGTLIDPSSVSP